MTSGLTAADEMRALLAEVRAEAPLLELTSFSHADARRLGAAAAAAAERDALPAAIRIVRGEQLVFQASFAGTTAEHDDWLRRKVNSARRHEVSSLELLLRHQGAGRAPDWLDPREFAVAGGAVPLFVQGGLAGIIAISGLVTSMRADHDLAMGAIMITRQQYPQAH